MESDARAPESLCHRAGIDPNKKIADLTEDEVNKSPYDSRRRRRGRGRPAQRNPQMNIKRLIEMGAYRGLRHRRGSTSARSADTHQCAYTQGSAARDCCGQEKSYGQDVIRKDSLKHGESTGKRRQERSRSRRRKSGLFCPRGLVHIQASFNDTIITIADHHPGDVIALIELGIAGVRRFARRHALLLATASLVDGGQQSQGDPVCGPWRVNVTAREPGANLLYSALATAGLEVRESRIRLRFRTMVVPSPEESVESKFRSCKQEERSPLRSVNCT